MENRKLNVKLIGLDRNLFFNCFVGLLIMLYCYRLWLLYGWLRDCKFWIGFVWLLNYYVFVIIL